MKLLHSAAERNTHASRGLTLVEVAVATLLMGVVLVGATNMLGNIIRGRTDNSDRAVGNLLAQQLMTEILSTQYEDPNSPDFGPETDELGSDRSAYDDVDDYAGWSEEEAADSNGVGVMTTSGWSRVVTVEFVDPADVATATMLDQGLKKITVSVLKDGELRGEMVALRSNVSE